MRGYKVCLIAVGLIIAVVMAFVLCSSSGDKEKYDGGTLVKSEGDSIYAVAFMDSRADDSEEMCNDPNRNSDSDNVIYAYVSDKYVRNNEERNTFTDETEAFIYNSSEGLVSVRKPEV